VNFRRPWKQLEEVQLTRLPESRQSPWREQSLGRTQGTVSDSRTPPPKRSLDESPATLMLPHRSLFIVNWGTFRLSLVLP
jgi:hypothetical protein